MNEKHEELKRYCEDNNIPVTQEALDLIARYTHGYYCEDCREFFGTDSAEYRKTQLMDDLWNCLHNVYVDQSRAGQAIDPDILSIKAEVGIGKTHDDPDDIIRRAESVLARHGATRRSASVVIS